MVKKEHVLFEDIPSKGKNGTYHSVVVTTYAIDLIHFDCRLRNSLHRKQVSSISILADGNQIDKTLEYASPQFLSHVGKDYTISNISANGHGVFHPKVNFFIGYDSVLILIGSGNLTVTGHGKNHEAFTGFMIDADNTKQRPLIEECWHYIKSFIFQCGDFEKRRLLQEIPENCRFLNDDMAIRHTHCTI